MPFNVRSIFFLRADARRQLRSLLSPARELNDNRAPLKLASKLGCGPEPCSVQPLETISQALCSDGQFDERMWLIWHVFY